jgi:hypothetical protein
MHGNARRLVDHHHMLIFKKNPGGCLRAEFVRNSEPCGVLDNVDRGGEHLLITRR